LQRDAWSHTLPDSKHTHILPNTHTNNYGPTTKYQICTNYHIGVAYVIVCTYLYKLQTTNYKLSHRRSLCDSLYISHRRSLCARKKSKEGYSSLQAGLPSSLQELTCHMGSHSVTCHPTEVTFPPLPQPKLVLDLATLEGRKAELT